MTDNVIDFARKREPDQSQPLECRKCGCQWFTAVVGFNSEMTKVSGWAVSNPQEGSLVRCHECGEQAP